MSSNDNRKFIRPPKGAPPNKLLFISSNPKNIVNKEPEIKTVICFMCKKSLVCSCCISSNECSLIDKFPKSCFSKEYGQIHLCSIECKDNWIYSRRNLQSGSV